MDSGEMRLPSFTLHSLPTLADRLGGAIPNPIASHPLYHPSPAFFISSTDVILRDILFDELLRVVVRRQRRPPRRLPPRGAAPRGRVRPGARARSHRHLRGALPRHEHRRPGARRRALGALRRARRLRRPERVPRVLLRGPAAPAAGPRDGAPLAQGRGHRAGDVARGLRPREDRGRHRAARVQPGVRHRRRRHDAGARGDLRRAPAARAPRGRRRRPEDGGQRRGHHRPLLRLPHGGGGGAARHRRGARGGRECGERRGARQAHRPQRRPHRAARHAQQPRRRLLPHPRGGLLPPRRRRAVRVPVPPPQGERPRRGRRRRGRRAAPHPETRPRPRAAAARRVRQPGVPGRGRVAKGRAAGVVGRGARRGALHGEVHRPDVHDPRRGGQRCRQPVLHAAGALGDPRRHGGVHWLRAGPDQRQLRVHPSGGGRRGAESCGHQGSQVGVGQVRHEPAGLCSQHGGAGYCWPLQGHVICESYVVYLGGHSHGRAGAALAANRERARRSHYALLGSVLRSEARARDAIFYSYTRHINGFAATLEEDEAAELSRHPRVVSVFPNRGHPLHTTRSWEFLGMEEEGGRVRPGSVWAKARFGEGVVIGNLDTGVWPEAGSFRDDGMGPAPAGWRGICQDQQASDDAQVRCNRKLIGARFFNKGYLATVGQQQVGANPASTRDTDGHGTHTLSTAAGLPVPGANLFGYGNGTAKGGAPGAHAAAYKVCWRPVNGSECFDADIVAAFDAAIHDGVHVLSVSLGGSPADYFRDGVAIGAFHAARHGVVVVCSAGNSGPGTGTVSNTAPWMVTVGASTMDREFPAFLVLDNNNRIKGQSLSPTRLPANKYYQLIGSEEAKGANATATQAKLCIEGSLDKAKAKGKIVVCVRGKNARVEKGEAVRRAGGVGMVLANDEASGNEMIADAHVLPATHITYSDGVALLSYLNSSRSASGYITVPYTALDTKPAPFMAAFSSQGPNSVTPQILKPDITAPGVSILAAFSGLAGPTGLAFDERRVLFNAESGTSMSCPHVAGIAGLLKAIHPDWSPAAIKSAIMTTARVQDNTRKAMSNSSFLRATPFVYGAGHVRPSRAADPGLVYDANATDYFAFLCALGYNSSAIATFTAGDGDGRACPARAPRPEDLNYPSVAVPHLSPTGAARTVTRRVRNVGAGPAAYDARVQAPRGVAVDVRPRRLEFAAAGEERQFTVTFRARAGLFLPGEYVFGRLVWSDGDRGHRVRSPLVVRVLDDDDDNNNKKPLSVA